VNTISYHIFRYPRNLEPKVVDQQLAKAFKMWTDNTDYTVIAKYSGKVQIAIRFERGSHDDADPFNGPGGSLAHAFFPLFGGDTHFDNEETWTIDTKRGKNFI
jgi:matrix metalloproteinase-14 (membrane-inserted)